MPRIHTIADLDWNLAEWPSVYEPEGLRHREMGAETLFVFPAAITRQGNDTYILRFTLHLLNLSNRREHIGLDDTGVDGAVINTVYGEEVEVAESDLTMPTSLIHALKRLAREYHVDIYCDWQPGEPMSIEIHEWPELVIYPTRFIESLVRKLSRWAAEMVVA